MADRRRPRPLPARGEVPSRHGTATGPRGTPLWADRLADDAQADAEGQEPTDPPAPSHQQTTQWPPAY